MAPSAVEKAEKAEAEACASLKLTLKHVEKKLQPPERAQLTVRVVDNLIKKLEEGLGAHERSITELVVAAGQDEERVDELSLKLSSLVDQANPSLDELYSTQSTLKAANAIPATIQPSRKGFISVQLKIRMAKKTLESRLPLLQDSSKKADVLASLPMIQAKLKLLE